MLASEIVSGVGGLLLLIALGMLFWSLAQPDHRSRRRLLEGVASSVAHAPDGARVMITGRAAAGSEGEIVSPMTGVASLLYRATADRQSGHGTTSWTTLYREATGGAFCVSDATGTALVSPEGRRLVLRVDFEGGADPHRLAWLQSRLGYTTGGLRFVEKRICAGDTLTVVGTARHTPDGMLLTAALVTTLPPEQAARELGSNVNVSLGLGVAALATIAVGVTLGYLG